jgi:hypothetical protein
VSTLYPFIYKILFTSQKWASSQPIYGNEDITRIHLYHLGKCKSEPPLLFWKAESCSFRSYHQSGY